MRYRFLGLTLEASRFSLTGASGDSALAPANYRVLEHLVRNRHRVVTKEELLEAGWPGVAVTPNSLAQSVRQLRDALAEQCGDASTIETAYGRGYRFVPEVEVLGHATPALDAPFRDRPALAVLPFDASGELGAERLAFTHGLAEDLTNRLASYRWFPLISQATLASWERAGGKLEQAVAQLGATYVVSGSVRKAGERVRLAVELVDAASGRLVTAETYEALFGELFARQSEMAAQIGAALEPELRRVEIHRALRRDPANAGAWDAFLRGLFHLWRYTADENREARAWFERAERADPGFAAPLTFHGLSHLNDVNAGWTSDPGASAARAIALARRGVAVDARDPHARALLGGMLAVFGEKADAVAMIEQALAENPSFAWGHWALARGLSIWGRADEAVSHLKTALRLSPHDPLLAHFHEGLAFAHFARADYALALAAARESARLRADWPRVYQVLCASAAALGRGGEARRAREHGAALGERRPVAQIRASFARAGATPEFVESYASALASGGWT
ncbi:MAG TPA: winged helix-turn-helix domain-containing protein [Myxococcota bacterium]|jgi:TolB-like protein/Flp pilus assembly protein TadD